MIRQPFLCPSASGSELYDYFWMRTRKYNNRYGKHQSYRRLRKQPQTYIIRNTQEADHGSPRKVVEKAKNNYFCSMETGYELFLPEGILTYFEVTHADRTATAILIYLDEKDLSEEERSGKHLQSKGFYPPASIHDFPLRGKSLILHVRRRRWVDLDTGNPYMRAWEVVAKGTRLTEEFASFLKGTPG